MESISNRILNMEESATLKMANLAWQLKEEGKDIISLSLGEPDFDTPDFIKDAANKAIDNNFTHYPPVPGYKDVRESISKKFKRDNNLDYSADQIVISTGAKHSLMNLCLALLNPGDEVVLPAPYWVSYMAMAKFAEGTPVELKTDITTDFKVTAEQLDDALNEKSKLFIFSNPCNPSGSVYSEKELRELASVFEKYPNCYIVSDEIYELINFEGKNFSIGTIDSIRDRVITVNGVAKGFSMTGWRIGYIGAPLHVAKACTKLQGQFTSGANTIAQKATQVAVSESPERVIEMKKVFHKRRDLFVSLLKEIPGMKVNEPQGAFYVFPDISSFIGKKLDNKIIENVNALSMSILAEVQVAITPGDAFGTPNNIRLSYANSDEQLREAASRLKSYFARLK